MSEEARETSFQKPTSQEKRKGKKLGKLATLAAAVALAPAAVIGGLKATQHGGEGKEPMVLPPTTTAQKPAEPEGTPQIVIKTPEAQSTPQPSPTPKFEKTPISETASTPSVEFEDGIDQQVKDSILSIVNKLPPIGNTKIQITKLDKERFWINEDGIPTLEAGVAGFYWQQNFFHGLAHALDPQLNPEIARVRTPEQNSQLIKAIEKAKSDQFWGENLALEILYNPEKNVASTHPEIKGENIDRQILNSLIRLRPDGAYIGRSSEFVQNTKPNFIFGPEFLDPTLIERFAQQTTGYNGSGSISEFITVNQNLLDQLSTSSPYWKLAIEDIRQYATLFDNYEWSETQISLPRPLKFVDKDNAMSILTFGDLVLRNRFLQKNPELLSLLSQEQQASITRDLNTQVAIYQQELFASGLGMILEFENPELLEVKYGEIKLEVPIEQIRSLLRETPYYEVYLALSSTTS